MTNEPDNPLNLITDAGSLGPEPSEQYLASLDLLDNVTRECVFVSRDHGGIASPTGAHFYASVLFTQMVTKCVSLLTLAPHTPWAHKRIEHWDYGSMTGIARTLIELRIAYFYLCTEERGEDQWRLRWNLFNLHDCTSRIRMFDVIGEQGEVAGLQEQAEELRERLTSNPEFQALDPKRHRKLLHGQTAYLFPLETIAERAGIDLAMFRYLYVLLSSHVHALPMSFYRMGGDNPDRGRGLPSPVEENYSALCMSLAATLLAASRDEFEEMFADHRPAEPISPVPLPEEPEAPALAVGEEVTIDASPDIAFRWRRTAEDVLSTTYLHRATGEAVLERADHDDGTVELSWADPVFWTFTVDGQPATEASLDRATSGPHAHRIDHNGRRILIKTPGADVEPGASGSRSC